MELDWDSEFGLLNTKTLFDIPLKFRFVKQLRKPSEKQNLQLMMPMLNKIKVIQCFKIFFCLSLSFLQLFQINSPCLPKYLAPKSS